VSTAHLKYVHKLQKLWNHVNHSLAEANAPQINQRQMQDIEREWVEKRQKNKSQAEFKVC
jgi:hypothetical protein